MSWEAGVLSLLALTLVGGFAWYERSRPPSQIVALVAALAAISVAGRVAFSPIPNVVPSTDIALIAGYALGGAPGFAVGALTGLVSNFWLGQGPWTPWEMAGWGMTGLFGAALAAVSRREVGRLRLALVCALAGFAYGALLDFSLMVTYGGEQSLDRFLALSARGLPFNIAHATGNAALALVAGPAMVRMLTRYRRRFEFAWKQGPATGRRVPGTAAGAACLVAVLLLAASVPQGGERASASGRGSGAAVSWLRGAQNGDGGFGFGEGVESSPAMTGWAVLGLEAAGVNPLDVDRGDATPISYLAGTIGQVRTTGDLERTILAVRGAGLDPGHFQGHDLVTRLLARQGGDGSFSGQVNQAAFGVLALRAAGAIGAIGRTAGWLRDHQNADGGWGFAAGASSDADTTGAVVQALAASGTRAGIGGGATYLRSAQRAGGGFPLNGGPVNAQSTAYAIQGLIAAGVSPAAARVGGRSSLDYLASVQAGDGHYRYSSSSDQTPVWVTGQALMAVNGRALPLAPAPREVSQKSPTASGSSPSSGSGKPDSTTVTAKAGAKSASKTHAKSSPESPVVGKSVTGYAPVAGTDAGDDSGVPTWVVLAGFGLALVAVWGGWLLYRRRLP
jgi:energy-coupling factor transport system substrate-specific component